jgi:hypothetical protein
VKLAEMDAKLSPEQRHAVGNVAVSGWLPMEFYVRRTGMRRMPEDQRIWQALLDGLDALAHLLIARRWRSAGEAASARVIAAGQSARCRGFYGDRGRGW